MSNKTATFFCSASNTIDPIYNKAAREVVRAACLAGYVIASGGTTKGTMKVVVDAARESGGKTLGVIPKFMDEHYNPEVDHVIWTETMAERKQILRDNSDICIALPGGIGTLDELIETLVLVKLGKYKGKLIIFNYNHFYDKLKDLLDFYVSTGMLDAPSRDLALFPETVQELVQLI